MENELVVLDGGTNLPIYPFSDWGWQQHVDRFGFAVPKVIVDRTMGISTCAICRQTYAGNQNTCVKPRWGYVVDRNGWRNNVEFGHRFVGDVVGDVVGDGYSDRRYPVIGSKEYPCGGRLTWDLSEEFQKQQSLFSSLSYIARALSASSTVEGFNLTLDQREKIALYQQLETLTYENQAIKHALKEVANRLNAGGQGLLGGGWSF